MGRTDPQQGRGPLDNLDEIWLVDDSTGTIIDDDFVEFYSRTWTSEWDVDESSPADDCDVS